MSSPERATSWRGRIVVLLGISLAALNLRTAVASVSPLLETIRLDFTITDSQAGVLGMVPVLAFAFFGSVTPALSRKIGLEPLLILAMLIAAAGVALRSSVHSASAFIIWSLVALGGMGMGNVLLPPLVKRYFPDKIGPVTAIYTTLIAVSTALPPLFVVPMARTFGWRFSLGQWALIGALSVVPWLVVIFGSLRRRRQVEGILSHDADAQSAPRDQARTRAGGRIWRSRTAWALGLFLAANSSNSYAMFAWLPLVLTDAGIGEAAAARWLALYAAFGIITSLGAPVLAARMRNAYPIVVFFAVCTVIGYLGFIIAPTTGTLLWVTAIGIGAGTFPMALALVNLRSRSAVGSATLSGFSQGVGYTFAALGPLGVGMLYEAWGNWTVPLSALIASMAVILVAGWFATRRVVVEDEWFRRW
ncbi:MAG TPA: MFS transporter [Actinomycetales bacterium]|nr:MFS transporter [Actinomycetales bacterium]